MGQMWKYDKRLGKTTFSSSVLKLMRLLSSGKREPRERYAHLTNLINFVLFGTEAVMMFLPHHDIITIARLVARLGGTNFTTCQKK